MGKLIGLAAVAAACLVLVTSPAKAADAKTTKEIMKAAHGGVKKGEKTLYDKAIAKDATDADKKAIAALYADLPKNDPPKGDKAEWKKKTEEIAKAAADLADNKEGAAAALTKAGDCMACHTAFRPKK